MPGQLAGVHLPDRAPSCPILFITKHAPFGVQLKNQPRLASCHRRTHGTELNALQDLGSTPWKRRSRILGFVRCTHSPRRRTYRPWQSAFCQALWRDQTN